MEHFIFEANIGHYKELLATDADPRKIATLRKLLAEEEAWLAVAAVAATVAVAVTVVAAVA
jgi:hypothetical protein